MTMRKIAIAIATGAALLAAPTLQAKPKLTPQQQLDKLLAGRVAGKPVHCIPDFDAREMQVLDKTAIVYGRGNTIWVNIPRNVADLDDDEIQVIRSNGSQLCDLDIVRTLDRGGHFPTGFISLGEFVPYRKVAKAAN